MCLPPTGESKDTGTPRIVLGKLSPNFPAATRARGRIMPGLGAARIYPGCFQSVSGVHVPGGKHREGHQCHHQGPAGTLSTSTGWGPPVGQRGPTGGCGTGTGGSMDEGTTGTGTKRRWEPRLRGPVGHHDPWKRHREPEVRGPTGEEDIG